MEYKDYYSILGVPKNADEKAIKKAYRKLARQYHPDVNPGDKDAERKFKEINEAYTVLSDPDKRKKYDRFGAQWEQYERAGVNPDDFAWGGFGQPGGRAQQRTVTPDEFEQMFGGMGFSDFFESLFGGGRPRTESPRSTGFGGRSAIRQRGQDVTVPVRVSLEEAFHGTNRMLQMDDGRRIEVKIPRGVKTGSRVRVSGEGGPGIGGGRPGDLYLEIEVAPHPQFTREEDDLRVTVPVDLFTAVLGGEVQVPTLERPVVLKIPEGTQNGKTFRLRGLGMPHIKNPDKRGDLYAIVDVQIPTRLTPEERELFEKLRALRTAKVH
jgi:curved DNA-binding protein